MDYQEKDLIFAQITNCLVEDYNYNIVRFSDHEFDIWLTNKENNKYPILRLNSVSSSSTIFEQDYLKRAKDFLEVFIGKDKPVLILNTNPNSEGFDDDGFTQEVISYEQLGEHVLEAFPKLKVAIKKVEDTDKEIERLNKNLLSIQERKQAQQQKQARKVPKFTMIIAVICIIAFVASTLIGANVGNETSGLIISGAYYKMFVVSAFEYWRFLSAGFLHLNIMHLLVNLMALYSLGALMEKMYSKKTYIAILITSILVGNLFVFIMDANILAVGLSGGLYGLMAACIVFTFENNTIKIPVIRQTILRTVAINILISFMPGVSLSAHLGGFIAGAFMSFILIKSERWKAFKPHVIASFVLVLGMLGYFGYQSATSTVEPQFLQTDVDVLDGYRKLGLDPYANYLEKQLVQQYNKDVFKK